MPRLIGPRAPGNAAYRRGHLGNLEERYGYVNRGCPDAELGPFVTPWQAHIAGSTAAIAHQAPGRHPDSAV